MKIQKKIAFVGTSCIGKTTLIEYYRRNYGNNPQFAFADEAARMFFIQNPTISDRFSVETQEQVQSLALSNEKQAIITNAAFIFCDRSVLDAPAYIRANGDKKGAIELLKKVLQWIPTYDKIFLLDPRNIPYETDEVRKESEKDRERFHQGFIDFFIENTIPYELLSGTIEGRLEKINVFLNL